MIGFNSPEFKVGSLVIVVSTLIGGLSLKLAEGPNILSGSRRHYFDVEDAGGLVKNSAVKMAGIKVGVIDDIKLVDGKARVFLNLDDETPIKTSSQVEIRSDGILGDKHVEILSGYSEDPLLESGNPIKGVLDQGSLNELIKEVSQVTKSLGEVAKNLNAATKDVGDDTTPLGRIVLNIERLTEDLAEISGRNKGKINDIIDRVQSVVSQLDDLVDQELVSSVNNSLRNIEEVTDKINSGEGTIGRLINDSETIDGINEAIEGVNDFLGGARDLETSIDFHTEHLTRVGLSKSFVFARLTPGLDRYYEIGIVDDPRGVTRTEVLQETPFGEPTTEVETVKTFKNKLKFTALFAKGFHDLTVKGGIIENSGGVGFDYYLMNQRLRFSVEAFDFDDIYLRSFIRYNFFKGVYLVGGGDNMLSSESDGGAFLGAGIFLTNEDLKFFASKFSF